MSETTAATGLYTTNGTPHSYTTLTPFLAILGAAKAAKFYARIFGAEILDITMIGGEAVHVDLKFPQGRLAIGEPSHDYGTIAAPGGEEACYSMSIYVPNVDEVVEAAVAAGALLREPIAYFASGDRYGSIRDPFGVRWSVMTRVKDLSDEESAAEVAAWAATQAG